MPEMIVRKCTACKEPIAISRNDLAGVIYYDKAYYHKACFCERAAKRSQSKCKKQKEWQSALNNISELEIDTRRMLKSSLDQNDLNEWLLQHYDIAAVPKRLWQVAADLERGIYKGKKCKPVSMETLLGVWKWGQRKLDSIASNNKMKHTGPQNDEARIAYDLAVLVQKVPVFLSYQEKQKSAKQEMARITIDNDVDMFRIGQTKQAVKRDISDISDDIFVE